MHFLKQLLENPKDPDPVKNMPYVHRHFMRYSKGEFDGPGMKIKFTSSKININASFEYEDALGLLLGKCLPDSYSDEFAVTGNIIAAGDFTNKIRAIGLNWEVKKSTGKTKNFKCALKPAAKATLTKQQLIGLVENICPIAYVLLNFKAGPANDFTIKTAKNPPRPKSKGGSSPEDEAKEKAAKLKFSTVKLPKTEEAVQHLLNEIVFDFKDEVSSKAKTIEVYNTYKVENLIIPPLDKIKNTSLIRKLTLKELKLTRTVIVDGTEFNKVHDIKI